MSAFTFTLPLAPNRYAFLQIPSRTISVGEWKQMLSLLDVMKPGLVKPPGKGRALRRTRIFPGSRKRRVW